MTEPTLLLPPPRSLERLPGSFAPPRGERHAGDRDDPSWLSCQVRPDCGLAAEGYELTISPAPTQGCAVRITAATEAGARHGRRTLSQLLRCHPTTLPCLRIADSPTFATRGVMLDVSRDRVPTMAQLEAAVEQLASWKINHLQLYTEHTFAYAGHEDVWRDASPMTPAEIRSLDSFCRDRGVELVANQNCFGHLHRWLALPRYAALAETTGDWSFYDIVRSGGFSLCPQDPGSIQLVDDLLEQLLPCFDSDLVNIGCDETYDVGQGRSRDEVERRGAAAVYYDFLEKVVTTARRRGGRPMFWADIALSHPEAIGRIPHDVIALAWGYEPDSPFPRWMEALATAGCEAWVCPGTSSWRTMLGRTRERNENLAAAARAGSAGGATGYLVTDWGDLGHRQQWPISLHGLAAGAARAWNAAVEPSAEATSRFAFDDATGGTGRWLERAGDADAALRGIAGKPDDRGRPTRLANASALFADLGEPLAGGRPIADAAAWLELESRLRTLADEVPSTAPEDIREELAHSAQVAIFAAQRAAIRAGSAPSGDLSALRAQLDAIQLEHRRLWLRRCRPGGLDSSCRHYSRSLPV